MDASAAVASPKAESALAALEDVLRRMGAVIVCYSGGVDSALVLAVAARVLGDRAIGLTAVSPSLARADLEDAKSLAKRIGAVHRLVESHEIDVAEYQRNAPDRCFHCKSELYAIAEKKRAEWGIDNVVNGTNVDDLGDYRPGLEAAKNASVRSPLVELGVGKTTVREMAARLDLPVWDRPASACLSSRIAFGTRVTRERLSMVERFESELRALGFRGLRVRYHAIPGPGGGEDVAFARIEVPVADLARVASADVAPKLHELGRDLGFAYVTLDLGGYRVGSHNEVLKRKLTVLS